MKKKLLSKWVDNSIIVSCQQVSAYIKEEFGVKFSVSGTYKLLLSLGYGFKQLSLFPSKLDVEKQNEWVNEYRTLESSLDDDEVILFLPACRQAGTGFTHSTIRAVPGCGARKGRESTSPPTAAGKESI